MAGFEITQNDTSPSLTATLYENAALTTPVDLDGATVVFWMRSMDNATLVDDQSVTVVSAANGQVRYDWQSGDTDTVGKHYAKFKVTFADGKVGHFPNFENINVTIYSDKS